MVAFLFYYNYFSEYVIYTRYSPLHFMVKEGAVVTLRVPCHQEVKSRRGYWSPSAVIPSVPKLKMETALPTGDSKVLLSRQGINTPKSV